MTPFSKRGWLAAIVCIVVLEANAEPGRRALLIGINDYESRSPVATSQRHFRNLEGSVNDVELMRELLLSVYHFDDGEILVLTNQAASRTAILDAIDRHLAEGAQKGDTLLFYFSGHGSQVRNSLSAEPDLLDESIVPADAHDGVPDIRDKELRRRFRPLLDRGVRLTVILDSCHSGSGVRGLPRGSVARFAMPDLRDVRDAENGLALEESGALILSAAQDLDLAFETSGREGKKHGVFSWSWARAIRDAAPGETALETFQRAAALMALERPEQVPVLAGNAEARYAPFLGVREDRKADRLVVAIRSIDQHGGVALAGGWANGLTLESELRPMTNPPSTTRLRITELDGVTESSARVVSGSSDTIAAGALLELVGWAPPGNRPLRVWIPESDDRTASFARELASATNRDGLRRTDDPTARTPQWVIRWDGANWQSFDPARAPTNLGRASDRRAVLRTIAGGASVFVQIPVLRDISRRIAPRGWSVERVTQPQDADYILTGRLFRGKVEYAWIRPSAETSNAIQSALPSRTDWHGGRTGEDVAAALTEDLRRLQRIHLWQTLPSPPETPYPYRLAIRRMRDRAWIVDKTLIAEETYEFVLRTMEGSPEGIRPRFVYLFMVDSYGKSTLIFPRGPLGSVENRFPRPKTALSEISLGADASLIPQAPFGTDTYYLLSTTDALSNPWILEWDGVRTPRERGQTPLERLILQSQSGDRGVDLIPPASQWSIERLSCTSVEARQPQVVR